jgi:hypothetical protein
MFCTWKLVYFAANIFYIVMLGILYFGFKGKPFDTTFEKKVDKKTGEKKEVAVKGPILSVGVTNNLMKTFTHHTANPCAQEHKVQIWTAAVWLLCMPSPQQLRARENSACPSLAYHCRYTPNAIAARLLVGSHLKLLQVFGSLLCIAPCV